MPKAKRDNTVPPTSPTTLGITPATAYLPFVVSEFQELENGRWRAAGVPLPSDHVERIELVVTRKPGVRLTNVGRSCALVASAHLAVGLAGSSAAAETGAPPVRVRTAPHAAPDLERRPSRSTMVQRRPVT
jgi:hypothetical protein